MLTVHQMPLKNLLLTGISCDFDKTLSQKEQQPFTLLNFFSICHHFDNQNSQMDCFLAQSPTDVFIFGVYK